MGVEFANAENAARDAALEDWGSGFLSILETLSATLRESAFASIKFETTEASSPFLRCREALALGWRGENEVEEEEGGEIRPPPPRLLLDVSETAAAGLVGLPPSLAPLLLATRFEREGDWMRIEDVEAVRCREDSVDFAKLKTSPLPLLEEEFERSSRPVKEALVMVSTPIGGASGVDKRISLTFTLPLAAGTGVGTRLWTHARPTAHASLSAAAAKERSMFKMATMCVARAGALASGSIFSLERVAKREVGRNCCCCCCC
jgi:hypothetical protein